MTAAVEPKAAPVWRAFAKACGPLLGSLTSAALWFVLMFVVGVASVVAGVFILLGAGWALVAFGGIAIASALLIARGMNRA